MTRCLHIDFNEVSTKKTHPLYANKGLYAIGSTDGSEATNDREQNEDNYSDQDRLEDIDEEDDDQDDAHDRMIDQQPQDEDFKFIPSKEERHTMFSNDHKLEEEKEAPEDYFRSVNEFSSK